MSLGVAFKGPEGIVLAADSRVTLMAQMQQPNLPTMLVPATYDHATKLLRVTGQDHVGAITYGLGAMGATEPRTARSLIPEFEAELAGAKVGRLSIPDFAQKLSDFFFGRWKKLMPGPQSAEDMVFLVGGYDVGSAYGRLFEFHVPSRPKPSELHPGPEFGGVWGGQKEIADRLIQGFDDRAMVLTKDFLGLDDKKTADLHAHLKQGLQLPVPYAVLPLQDCIDLAIVLIRTTIALQQSALGLRGVGGAIDIAVITPADGFVDLQTKKLTGGGG